MSKCCPWTLVGNYVGWRKFQISRFRNDLMLSRSPLVHGRLLATRVWPIPANVAILRLYL